VFLSLSSFHSTSEAKSAEAALKMLTHTKQGDHGSNRAKPRERTENPKRFLIGGRPVILDIHIRRWRNDKEMARTTRGSEGELL
jgi:hypothetical protein